MTENNPIDIQPDCPNFHIDVLVLLDQNRMQHGLRHGNYQRYRRYCRDRVKRSRKSLKSFKKGKAGGHPVVITSDMCSTLNHLTIPLFCAERCWAHSMELRLSEAFKQKHCQHYAIRKMHKFCKYAQQFWQLIESTKSDVSTQLEAKAYYTWGLTNFYLELKNWNEALNYILQSRKLFDAVMNIAATNTRVIYQSRIEELNISEKYCLYNLGQTDQKSEQLIQLYASLNVDDYTSQFSTALAEARKVLTTNVITVTWLDQPLAIYTDKARSFIYHLNNKTTEITQLLQSHSNKISLTEKQLKLYDTYLLECKDALQEIHDLLVGNKTSNNAAASIGTHRDLEQIQTYLTYLKLTLSSERNFHLAGDLWRKLNHEENDYTNATSKSFLSEGGLSLNSKKNRVGKKSQLKSSIHPENFIRLFDEAIQNIMEINNLTGVSQNAAIKKLNDCSLSLCKGIRGFYGALLLKSQAKFKESSCLLYRCIQHFNQAKSLLDSSPVFNVITEQMNVYEERISSLKFETDISSLSGHSGNQIDITKLKPLYERLGENVLEEVEAMNSSLINVPCSPLPLPCKPILYDITSNHISWPSIPPELQKKSVNVLLPNPPQPSIPTSTPESIQESKPLPTETKPSGITDYVKSWFWGGK